MEASEGSLFIWSTDRQKDSVVVAGRFFVPSPPETDIGDMRGRMSHLCHNGCIRMESSFSLDHYTDFNAYSDNGYRDTFFASIGSTLHVSPFPTGVTVSEEVCSGSTLGILKSSTLPNPVSNSDLLRELPRRGKCRPITRSRE